MTAPVPITWTDCTLAQLHDLASKSKSVKTGYRLMAIAMIKRGMSRRTVAEAFKVTTRSFRNRVMRYNAEGPAGLADKPRSGRPPRLAATERDLLALWVEAGPDPQADGGCRWREVDLLGKLVIPSHTALCPGFVATDMTADVTTFPHDEMMEPSDIAELAATLIALSNTASVAELIVNCRNDVTL